MLKNAFDDLTDNKYKILQGFVISMSRNNPAVIAMAEYIKKSKDAEKRGLDKIAKESGSKPSDRLKTEQRADRQVEIDKESANIQQKQLEKLISIDKKINGGGGTSSGNGGENGSFSSSGGFGGMLGAASLASLFTRLNPAAIASLGKLLGPVAALTAAGYAGFKLGEMINEKTGLSDMVSRGLTAISDVIDRLNGTKAKTDAGEAYDTTRLDLMRRYRLGEINKTQADRMNQEAAITAQQAGFDVTSRAPIQFGGDETNPWVRTLPMPQPNSTGGSTLDSRIGEVTSASESSSGRNTVSTGRGDYGGVSYGDYQLSSKMGTAAAWLASPEGEAFRSTFLHQVPGTPQFTRTYRELENTRAKELKDSQHAFIMRTHYGNTIKQLGNLGSELAQRGGAIQELLFSTSNQYGNLAPSIFKKALGTSIKGMSDTDIISKIQDYKLENVESHFKSSSPDFRQSIASNRIPDEKNRLIAMAASAPRSEAVLSTKPMMSSTAPSTTPTIINAPVTVANNNASNGGSGYPSGLGAEKTTIDTLFEKQTF